MRRIDNRAKLVEKKKSWMGVLGSDCGDHIRAKAIYSGTIATKI